MSDGLARRLWIYQAERFPLKKTVPLLAVFGAASVNVSATLAGRDLPGLAAYGLAAVLGLAIFFQMRAADEWKDLEDDRRYRPERPIPRGLVSLSLILALGAASAGLAGGLALAWSGMLFGLLALVWLWLAAMMLEFGAPAWLKARPILYLVSHMAIMPLIDLMLTGIEWAGAGTGPPPGLWLFLVLTFLNGAALEIGRKVWAPESERTGVETYSGLWGPARAAWVWTGLVALAAVFLVLLGHRLGAPVTATIAAVAGLALVAAATLGFVRTPTPQRAQRIDTVAGLWVLIAYLAAGFGPLIEGTGA